MLLFCAAIRRDSVSLLNRVLKTPLQMSMWKPILNQAHFYRMHKTKPRQQKFYKANSIKELF